MNTIPRKYPRRALHRPRHALIVAAAACVSLASLAWACGPDFPLSLLQNRDASLRFVPANSFLYEASHLYPSSVSSSEIPPHPWNRFGVIDRGDFAVVNGKPYRPSPRSGTDRRAMIEGANLTPAQTAALAAMRQAHGGKEAWALGETLPPAIRLYTAGAVDFNRGAGGLGKDYFLRILALPENEAAPRVVWAAYMLGRIEAEDAVSTAAPPENLPAGEQRRHKAAIEQQRLEHFRIAREYFARARTLAAAGAPDPLDLSSASLGAEGRLQLDQTDLCSYRHGAAEYRLPSASGDKSACPEGCRTYEPKVLEYAFSPGCEAGYLQAAALYAEQAARERATGPGSGVDSLHLLARRALDEPALLTATIADPLQQRLLVAYALARVGDLQELEEGKIYDSFESGDSYWPDIGIGSTGPDSATNATNATNSDAKSGTTNSRPALKPNPLLSKLIAAIEAGGLDHVAGVDRLAALAYRSGHFELAGRLAAKDRTALARWVTAKLALQRGDLNAAAAAYAEALKGFPPLDERPASGDGHPRPDMSLAPELTRRLRGEAGVLALARGEYVAALETLSLAAQAEEKVRTAELLARYGEAFPIVPAYAEDAFYVAERVVTVDELKAFVDARLPATAIPAQPSPPGAIADDNYRSTWAPFTDRMRTLLARRLLRMERYDEALPYFPAPGDWRFIDPDARLHAEEYGAARRAAQNAWGRIARAENIFRAAVLARRHGMELLGFEGDPDYALWDGGYNIGPRELAGPYITAEEKTRVKQTRAQPETRYHYRDTAILLATQAADQLPTRSQAFAAVICRATGWAQSQRQQERVAALYAHYLRYGAYVPWGRAFGENGGRNCPDPEFERAASLLWKQPLIDAREWMKECMQWENLREKSPLLTVGAAAILAIFMGIFRRKRRRI